MADPAVKESFTTALPEAVREAFEAWISAPPYGYPVSRSVGDRECYASELVEFASLVWQESARQQARRDAEICEKRSAESWARYKDRNDPAGYNPHTEGCADAEDACAAAIRKAAGIE